jgi:hypothetical protein
MSERQMSETARAVMEELLDSGAVNFQAVGDALAKHGPELTREGVSRGSLVAWEPWEVFCGTMRWYVRVLMLPPVGGGLADLESLKQVGGELRQ